MAKKLNPPPTPAVTPTVDPGPPEVVTLALGWAVP